MPPPVGQFVGTRLCCSVGRPAGSLCGLANQVIRQEGMERLVNLPRSVMQRSPDMPNLNRKTGCLVRTCYRKLAWER